MFIKFLYFCGYTYIHDISPLQNFLLRPQIFLYSLAVSLALLPAILHLAPTSASFPGGARLIFPRKAARISTFRLAAFLSRVYLSAIRLFSPSSSPDPPSAAISSPDHPNIYEMYVAVPCRPFESTSFSLRTLPRSIHIKGTYSRVSSTPFNVYVSRRG